jgi:hypothetical protein
MKSPFFYSSYYIFLYEIAQGLKTHTLVRDFIFKNQRKAKLFVGSKNVKHFFETCNSVASFCYIKVSIK